MTREDLPDGWHATRLGDVITGFETGRSLSASGRSANADEVGVLKISAVTWGEFRPEENKALPAHHKPRPHEFVRPGDLLITRANTSELVGAVALVPPDRLNGQPRLVLPDKILRVLPKADVISPKYLLYALRAPEVRGHFAENATGTSDSMRNLSQPKLAAAPILLPPLAEQHRIVDRIDALLAKLSTARERLTRTQEILKRFRESVLAAACSGRLTEGWRVVRGLNGDPGVAESTQPELPYGWVSTKLGSLLREPLRNGHSARRSESGQGIRTLTLSAVTYGDFSQANTKLTVADADKVSDLWLEPGDILVERSNTPELVGTARLYRGSRHFAIFPDLLIRVRLNSEVLPEFAEIQLDSAQSHRYFIESAQGSAGSMPKIDQQVIADAPFVLPPIVEQRRIVDIFGNLRAVADTLDRRLALSAAVATRIPQAALALAFRGELVSTEATPP